MRNALKKKTNVESSYSKTVKQIRYHACSFFLKMYNKTIGFGFCDMRNYQGLGKCYNTYLDLALSWEFYYELFFINVDS